MPHHWCDTNHMCLIVAGLPESFLNFARSLALCNYYLLFSCRFASGQGSLSDMKGLIRALPQYGEMKDQLALHINLSQEIKTAISQRNLLDLAEIEQDLVGGWGGLVKGGCLCVTREWMHSI